MLKKLPTRSGCLKIGIALLLFSATAGCESTTKPSENTNAQEVIYHVFQRSFYDSNGDGQGDLKGLSQKLDYLQNLGVTSILLLPLYESEFYHNYFSGNFEKIDPEFGTTQDFLDLVKAAHQKGMKIYMDMETQYVTEDHAWYKDSYKNPRSQYSEYIVYDDSANAKPEPIIFNLSELKGYNGATKKVATVNLHSKKVLDYNYQLFKHWMDPNNDGKFDDGVDGFRLDHMMDNLDWKNKFTNLFTDFWTPLISRLKQVNPDIVFIAEQAEWGNLGKDYFEKGNVDRVFAFKLRNAIASFDKNEIAKMADSTFVITPANKNQVVFIENHDMQRFASAVAGDSGKLRVGAALNLLIGGIPSIYYGQELGMSGQGGFNKYGSTDANDIPQREAFEWYKADSGKGMAVWYKNTGPWWNETNLKPNDGISLEEEEINDRSLYNFYRDIIRLRSKHPALINGQYQTLANENNSVYSFLRKDKEETVLIMVNLSGRTQEPRFEIPHSDKGSITFEGLYGNSKVLVTSDGKGTTYLPEWGLTIWKLK